MTRRKGILRRAVERVLRSARPADGKRPEPERRWRLLQVESAIDCHLECVMCPWHDIRREVLAQGGGLMRPDVWRAIVPHLPQVAEIDFSGGGEPLLQPRLTDWVAEAHAAGCRTGFLTNALHLDEDTARGLLDAGIDWIATSIDGASTESYESIRVNSSFEDVCANLKRLAALRRDGRPATMVNFVLMERNRDELEAMVRLMADLGVDQLNVKQADVVRGERGKGAGLFAREETAEIRALQKQVDAAAKLGRRVGVAIEPFPFTPEQLPVCAQEPHHTLFVRCDGVVSACISLARGGPTTFFGQDAFMPTVEFGRLPDQDLLDVWEGPTCREYRERFEARIQAYEGVLTEGVSSKSPAAFENTLRRAAEAMPEACAGCRTCHYLYGV